MQHAPHLKCAPTLGVVAGTNATSEGPAAAAPTPQTALSAPPAQSVSCPTSWFLGPLQKTLKKLVRPAVAHTRRKELNVSMQMPRECFDEFMSPLTPAEAEGLTREASTGRLEPTSTTATLRKWHYSIRKGSVSDRLFALDTLDPPPPPARPAPKTKTVETQEIDGGGSARCPRRAG
jgi:hypothetical protein